MRIQKMPKDGNENSNDNNDTGLTSHEKLVWREVEELVSCQDKEVAEHMYVKLVMSPLLGPKHVDAGTRLLVAREFLESVEENVVSQRPSWRVDAAKVDTLRSSVLLMDDHTLFTCGSIKDETCISVEIKPKCGFLPDSSYITEENAIKKTRTRFEMHQVLKRQGNEISEISQYDPLDLFSGTKDRIHKAIRALSGTPQNNFRVFLNGSLVFGNFDGGIGKTTVKVEHAFELLLKGIISAGDGLCADNFIQLVTDTIYTSGVLDQLLGAQKLDKFDIEGVIHAYYDITGQACTVCRGSDESKISSQYSSMHSVPLDESLNIVKNYLIAATAKDCSLMISFRPTDAEHLGSSHSTLYLESTNQAFDYKVHFIDLDLKPLKKIEDYYELDKKIVARYLEIMKIRHEHGGDLSLDFCRTKR
ncbi:PREDICTED: inositol-pentakisphosphate 2-kinase isoform X2 [Tarenaya hassleriana]|nr:PREDICTED: inositol-pentakisphosphate 2-kinase isoform X2 [Tarenaya hassleriana]